MTALIHSFAESAIWDNKDQLRPSVLPVSFRVFSIGKIHGQRIDSEFVADYGVFFDPEDEYLLSHLHQVDEQIAWGKLVYWRHHDQGRVDIIDPQTDAVVGSITVRKRMGGDPSGQVDWTNVVSMVREK